MRVGKGSAAKVGSHGSTRYMYPTGYAIVYQTLPYYYCGIKEGDRIDTLSRWMLGMLPLLVDCKLLS